MKKQKILLSMVVVLAVLLTMGGCENSTSDDAKTAGRGVLGQISGVVYNTVTAQPIPGVTVEIPFKDSVKTDANGAYSFKDVTPGTYTVTFHLDGYQFKSRNIFVDPQQYIKGTDNPFLEVNAFQAQLKALDDWIQMQEKQGVPDLNGYAGDLTYTGNGVFVYGDAAAIEVKPQQVNNTQYEVKEIKMDYTYKKGLPMYLVGMAPLTGALKVQIQLFTTPKSEDFKQKLEVAAPIKDGVEFWFAETAAVVIGTSDPANEESDDTEVKVAAKYGPFFTKGGFLTATGLPVGVDLTLTSNGFLLDKGGAYYYFTGAKTYQYKFDSNGSFSETPGTFFKAENNSVENKIQNYTDKGTIYLFSEGNFAIITDIVAGDPVTPLAPTDPIVLTFSEAIDPATFVASVQVTGNVKSPASTGNIALTAEWDADLTTVTLVPTAATGATGNIRPVFPYSLIGTTKIGHLLIGGKSASGAKIYAYNTAGAVAVDTAIPVFTEEGLKLLDVDLSPAEGRVIVTAKKIKLIFNKPISTDSRFAFGATPNAAATDDKTVEYSLTDGNTAALVSTELLRTTTDVQIYYYVFSAADPIGDAPLTASFATALRKFFVEPLRLIGTNLYTAGAPLGFLSADGEDAQFPVTATPTPITLTFDKNIPITAEVVKVALGTTSGITLSSTTNGIALTKTVAGAVLTITPTVPLLYNQSYYLMVEIKKADDTYFTVSNLITNTVAATNGTQIRFKTALAPITVDDPSSKVAAKSAGLNSATSAELTVSGDSIFGNNPLKAGKTYYVQFEGAAPSVNVAYTPMSFTGLNDADPVPTVPYKNALADDQFEDLNIVIGFLGNVMTIRVDVVKPAAGLTEPPPYELKAQYTNVGLKYGIGEDWEDLSNPTTPVKKYNGKINTTSGKFNISGLTVNYERP